MNENALDKKREALLDEKERLEQELYELDQLMRMAGFSNGLETVKATAREIIRYGEEDLPLEDEAA
jgi:hypothetical protein